MYYTLGLSIARFVLFGSTHIRATVVRRDSGLDYPMGLSNRDTLSPVWNGDAPAKVRGMALDGVCLDGFVSVPYTYEDAQSPSDYHYKLIGFEPTVRDAFSMTLADAKGYVKTLTAIDKAMNKADSEYGDKLEALAKAIGATFVCWKVTDNGTSYSNNQWTFASIAEGKRKLRAMITEAETELKEAKAYNRG